MVCKTKSFDSFTFQKVSVAFEETAAQANLEAIAKIESLIQDLDRVRLTSRVELLLLTRGQQFRAINKSFKLIERSLIRIIHTLQINTHESKESMLGSGTETTRPDHSATADYQSSAKATDSRNKFPKVSPALTKVA